jgi:hypothetical protein
MREIAQPRQLHRSVAPMKLLSSLPIPILILALIACGTAHAQRANHPSYALSYNRFGPLKIGMTVPTASKALGVPLIREEGHADNCHYVRPKSGFQGVSFMVTRGRISRVDIEAGPYRTLAGAKIGDSEARVKRFYPRVRVRPHPYVDWAHYMTVEFRGGKYLIIFETDGKRVTSYRVGRNPEAGFIEGCS